MSDKPRSNLKLNLAVTAGFVLIVVVGLAAPPLWRKYRELRRTLVVFVHADGTVVADGREFKLDAEKPIFAPAAPAAPAKVAPTDANAAFAELVRRRAAEWLPPLPSPPPRPTEKPSSVWPGSSLQVRLLADPRAACGLVGTIIQACKSVSAFNVTVNGDRLPPGYMTSDSPAAFEAPVLWLSWQDGSLVAILIHSGRLTAAAKPGTLPAVCHEITAGCVWVKAQGRVPLGEVLEAVRLLRQNKDRDVHLLIERDTEVEQK